jgi:hypothetical protein
MSKQDVSGGLGCFLICLGIAAIILALGYVGCFHNVTH